MMGWHSAQICVVCWVALRGEQTPARVIDGRSTDCALCGVDTAELPGIYVRVWGPIPPEPEPEPEQEPSA